MNPQDVHLAARELQLLLAPKTDVMFHGLSMEPLLREGDRVFVKPVAADEIEIGDIITYRHLDRFPTRRVVARRGADITLWCDNWPDLLFHAKAADILGRAEARTREGETTSRRDATWIQQRDKALRSFRRTRPWYALVRMRRAFAGILRHKRESPHHGQS